MAKNSKKTINDFLAPKRFALVGLSRDPKKFSRAVFNDLSKKGYEIFPVNPQMEEVEGKKCYATLNDLPQDVTHALIMTPKKETSEVVLQAAERGMKHIWIQQGAETDDALNLAKEKNIEVVQKACIYMFAEPTAGVHKFHRFLVKLFGQYPN